MSTSLLDDLPMLPGWKPVLEQIEPWLSALVKTSENEIAGSWKALEHEFLLRGQEFQNSFSSAETRKRIAQRRAQDDKVTAGAVITDRMSEIPQLRRLVARAPGILLAHLGVSTETLDGTAQPDQGEILAWLKAVWLFTCAADLLREFSDPAVRDLEYPRVIAALVRVTSAPWRSDHTWWTSAAERAFGTSERAAEAAEEARARWVACLHEHQSVAAFAGTSSERVDELLLDCHLIASTSQPLIFGPSPATTEPTSDSIWQLHETMAYRSAADVVDRQLLPRFAIGSSWRLVHSYGSRRRPSSPLARATRRRMSWSRFQLRWLASAAVGYAALISGTRAWDPPWQEAAKPGLAGAIPSCEQIPATGSRWLLAAALGMLLAGLGYMWLQMRSHAVGWWRGLTRGVGEAAIGIVYSGVVVVVGLVVQVPANILRWRRDPQENYAFFALVDNSPLCRLTWADALPLLGPKIALAISWSFAAGVFLQMLWQSEAVSVPLATHRWERR